MHDVTVALDHHLFRDLDAAEFRHAAQIVATKIDQHHVLGALFWIDNQFARELLVLG